ncbi:MAG: outer membrane beta-barrel protein [Acidimicrobiia bacterium]|nr:outer membrane beta-barrel protein [Acidimicrobiia bacterium]
MKTREFAIVCAVGLIVSGLVAPVAAEKGDKQITFGVLYSMPTDDLVVGTQTTELDEALGFGASFEFQVTDRIGIEPGVSSFSYDISVVEPGFPTVVGDTGLVAVTTNINFHFEKDSGLDLFVGPTIGYAIWDDITLSGFPTPASTDDEFMFGVNFGVDYPFGDGGWSFNGGLGYLAVDITPPGGDIGVSPIQVKVGLGYAF